MKKFITQLSVIAALLVLIIPAIKAQTNVSGGIYSNTTWTLANSPYIVTDTVVVFPGVTLTIEPGVIVKFADNKRLEIRQANIIAEGTSFDSITFTSNSTSPLLGIWSDIYLNNCPDTIKFNYCNFRYANHCINGSSSAVIINNSNFNNNNYGYFNDGYGNQFIVNTCNFINNTYGIFAPLSGSINFCNFLYNQTGLFVGGTYVKNCIVNSNQTGISGGGINIKNCIIDSNSINGVNFAYSTGLDSVINCQIKYNGNGINTGAKVITGNDIENNNIGINLEESYYNIYCNKICNNTSYDLVYTNPANISVANNYWCTPDSASTAAVIYDGYDNVSLGLVSFMPLDTSQCYLDGCALAVTATVINATCDTCHNGSATGHVANGFPPYTWTWYTSPMQSTQTATGLASGTYTLCVTDGHGCTACNNSIFIDSTNCTGYSINAFANNATCSSCNDGTAWVNVNGGTPPYAYTWYTIPMQNTPTATGLSQGTYHVCVTDLYGCTVCDSVIVSTGNCSGYFYLFPDTTTLHQYYAVNMASGVTPISYFWDWGDGTSDTIAYPSHTYSTAGFYTICLTITDLAGCTNMYCDSFYLQKNTNTIITVNVIPNTVTGINGTYYNNSFLIFPNPATNELTIAVPQKSEMEILNLEGQIIKSITANGAASTIDVSGFARGMYFVKVKTNKGIEVKKFIKK